MVVACSRGQGGAGGGRDAKAPRGPLTPIESYQHELRRLGAAETAALAAVAGATGTAYTDDARLLAALRGTALPRYREFVDGLAAIHPAGADLAAFHDRLLGLSRRELDALTRLEAAVARGDGTAVLLINQEQLRVRAEMTDLGQAFDRLAMAPASAPASGAPRP